jgi:protease II
MKIYKDPFTGRKYMNEATCIKAIERDHSLQLDKLNVTAKQVMFNYRNRLPLNTTNGKSVISGKPTNWNEKAGCYQRFSDDNERATYRQMFVERMQKVHGKTHLLNDPDQQRMMLANRSISGTYIFPDNTSKTYTGQEELALLKFFNEVLEWPGADLHMPAPMNFFYTDSNGKDRFYIPDMWIESLNLIIEVKGELHSYRIRDLHIEHAKDKVLETSGYNYVKVEDRDYGDLMDTLAMLKLGL